MRNLSFLMPFTHARSQDCVADLWGGFLKSPCRIPGSGTGPINSTPTTSQQSLTLSCWNCRGWATSVPYLEHIVQRGSDVIVISEHWLWPFELHKLNEFNPHYTSLGKADPRLNETSEASSRGCGGIGILSLDVTPITSIQSDRICGKERIWRQSILDIYFECTFPVWI